MAETPRMDAQTSVIPAQAKSGEQYRTVRLRLYAGLQPQWQKHRELDAQTSVIPA
jgi:hypothetical protein